jgi:recombination protein RecT
MSNGNPNAPSNPPNTPKQQAYTQSGQKMAGQSSNSLVKVMGEHRDYLDARLEKISKWVTQGVRPEALVRFALMDIQTSDKLRECSKESIYLALLACAVTGLEPGALKGEAYLVPFKQKAQFMPGWKGLVKQARRSSHVEAIGANVVREMDTFDLDLGTANTIIHKPLLRGDRGPVIGAYAIARMKGGHNEIEWMDIDDLKAIQKVAESRGASPAWRDWEDQMQRKSPIRRLCKRLPMGSDYFVTMALDDAHDQTPIIDLETDGEASRTMGSSADIRSAKPAQVEEPLDAEYSETPATDTATEAKDPPKEAAKPSDPPAKATAPKAQAPAAQASPGPAGRGGKYTSRGPASPPANDPKEPPKDAAPAELEERSCFTCGVPIEVPTSAPGGQQCAACKKS